MKRALALSAAATVLLALLSLVLGSVWWRMAALYVVMIPAAFTTRIEWRKLWRLRWWHLPAGLGGAVALYGAGWVVFRFLPPEQVAPLLAWKKQVPPALLWPLLVFIILGEEILWRNAVTMGIGGWRGAVVGAAAFAVAHVSLGMPALILAAFGAGLVWSTMVVATKSAWPAFVCHLAWDAAVMVLLPYATS